MIEDRDSRRTRATLLLRLRDLSDSEAWNQFLERYAPKIFHWCRRHRLQEADASDVTQEVLGKLVAAMRSFEYDPSKGSFRGWLKTVTNNAIRDLSKGWSRPGRGSGDTQVLQSLHALHAPEAIADLAAMIEAEAEREMLDEAHARIRLRVKPHTWQAYQLNAIDRQPAAEVAKTLGIAVSEVYVAKSRVIKMLRGEVAKLNGTDAPESQSAE
ncbi:RNA polymerase sigma factor RpoE [Planctomycetes bacterium Pan216]|uniref:RNA polymerase sigma factor RpoE n=1 Tax=Kolteria novifilia TaxID=2527975 RepID=A0A518B1W1_9BACT|nr:RNA polymerase sigma factor RpoE [Planctomycetes bacterium Pan216]